MKALLVGVLLLAGCGEVVQTNPSAILGATCSAGADCASGNCVDGVCCETACDGECMSCLGASTHGEDGTCLPVVANTDPDMECQSSCTDDGAVKSTCGGDGACTKATTSCGYNACDAATFTCRTGTCMDNASCGPKGYCNAAKVCAKRLKIALESNTGSCARAAAIANVKTALEARGHTVSVVAGSEIGTVAQISAYDVVVVPSTGAPCTMDDRAAYESVVAQYVNGGGGIVGNGWVMYNSPQPNFASTMPTSGMGFDSGALQMTPISTHPIVVGLNPFIAQAQYTPYGGTPKPGSFTLLRDPSNNATALAWYVGAGRAVFAGPLYLDDNASYANIGLTNGSIPDALEFFLRSIEWAGGGL